MSIIMPAQLSTQREASFTLGEAGDDYAAVCSSVRGEPVGSATIFQGMKPNATWSENSGWQLVITFADDYDDLESLWHYLYEHEGQSVPVTFHPRVGGTGFQATAAIVSAGFGGAARTVATSTVTIPLADRPTLIPATPTP